MKSTLKNSEFEKEAAAARLEANWTKPIFVTGLNKIFLRRCRLPDQTKVTSKSWRSWKTFSGQGKTVRQWKTLAAASWLAMRFFPSKDKIREKCFQLERVTESLSLQLIQFAYCSYCCFQYGFREKEDLDYSSQNSRACRFHPVQDPARNHLDLSVSQFNLAPLKRSHTLLIVWKPSSEACDQILWCRPRRPTPSNSPLKWRAVGSAHKGVFCGNHQERAQ